MNSFTCSFSQFMHVLSLSGLYLDHIDYDSDLILRSSIRIFLSPSGDLQEVTFLLDGPEAQTKEVF